MTNYKEKQEFRSIKFSADEKKAINKNFVNSFEEKNNLQKNKEWLKIKSTLKFI